MNFLAKVFEEKFEMKTEGAGIVMAANKGHSLVSETDCGGKSAADPDCSLRHRRALTKDGRDGDDTKLL
jgi:hypothetical protein